MKLTNKTLFWAKAHPDTIVPTKKDEDAGYDIYARFDQDYIIIKPHETKMIPTDLHCAFSQGKAMILKERGSTGTKGMGQKAGVIDAGFRGSIFVPINNQNTKSIIIVKNNEYLKDLLENPIGKALLDNMIVYPYEKAICQAIMVDLSDLTDSEIKLEDLLKIESERGQGMLGDSGK